MTPTGADGTWLERWYAHPRAALALRAGMAASVAWALALLVPGPAAEFPYYAPFGAVIATTFTLAGSVKESVQAVGSIALGGLIGAVVGLAPADSSPFAVALAVILGVVAAGWRPLGAMGGWVPTAAIFTLIIGRGEAWYAGAYAGLTLLGAVVGIGVNALLPPLPLVPVQRALELMRGALADELDDLAGLVEVEDRPSMVQWQRRHAVVVNCRTRMQAAVDSMELATHRNRRTRRYTAVISDIRQQVHVLDRLVFTIQDLADLLLHDGADGASAIRPPALGEELAPTVAEALRTIATTLRERRPAAGTGDDGGASANGADVREVVRSARQLSGREDEQIYVDGLLFSLRRAADALR